MKSPAAKNLTVSALLCPPSFLVDNMRDALARALVLHPKSLLMDEPLSSLDLELNVRLRKEILRLQGKLAFTLLYVTHDRDEAFSMATRVVTMSKGRMDYDGTVKDVRKRFKF
jgi:iron(III) transport system ATP-binding protein